MQHRRGKYNFYKRSVSFTQPLVVYNCVYMWLLPPRKEDRHHDPLGIQDGRLNHLEVKMDNIVVVEVLDPAANLTHEQTTVRLGQVEIFIRHPLKQLATIQVLHDQDHLYLNSYLYLHLYLHLYLCLYLQFGGWL